MLTRVHLGLILLPLVLLLIAAVSLTAAAQIHGVPPSVTSFGFGGSNNPAPGVPASVTSLGPNGFGGGPCCFGPFISTFHKRGFDHHSFHDHLRFPVGEMSPAYVPLPYAVPYPVPYAEYDMGEDNGAQVDPAYLRGVPSGYERSSGYAPITRNTTEERASAREVPSAKKDAETLPELPVASVPQPMTVLVYKDGHKVEVQNYAILGNTLFAFEGNLSHRIQLTDLDLAATRKTNDDRGVEFHIPGEKASAR